MDRPLEIEGEFLLEFDGGHARIDIRDDVVDIQIPDHRAALAMMRQVPSSTRRDALLRADVAMRDVGLVGRIRIGGRAVARFGGTDRPSPLARLLGVDPLSLSLFSLIGSVFGRKKSSMPSPADRGPRS